MAQLPADRTKLAQAQSNMSPSLTASSQKTKEALTEAYDTIDLLNQKADNHAAAATLPHADKSVTRAKLADKVVGAGQLDDAAVGQSHHQDNGIPSRAIGDNVILQRHMSDNSVGSPELQTGAVQRTHLGSGVVGSTQLDPLLLQNYGDIAVQAQLADIVQVVNNAMSHAAIQNVLNTAKRIRFKPGTYTIDLTLATLSAQSNTVIDFEQGAVLQALGSNLENYRIFQVEGKVNVTINNIQIVGERNTHIGTTGTWGFGLYIGGSKNVVINYPVCSNCWGDGIYVSDLNENIVINRPNCDNNRRQGISVIGCKGLDIISPRLTNTNGTDPQAGIDFEPNVGTMGLENVRVTNPYTENNAGPGITIALVQLGNTNKVVDITIDNHKDNGSLYGFYLGDVVGKLKGAISVRKPVYSNNKQSGIYARNYSVDAPKVEIESPTIINPNRTLIGSTKFDSAILVSREVTDITTSDIGNIHISKPTILCDDANTKSAIVMYDSIAGKTAKKCSLIDPIEISSTIPTKLQYNVETFNTSDKFRQLRKSVTAATTNVYATEGYLLFDNLGAPSTTTFNLQDALSIGWEVEFRVVTNKFIVVVPAVDEIILPNNTTVGKGIVSDMVGARIRLKKVSNTAWHITEIIGTWTQQV